MALHEIYDSKEIEKLPENMIVYKIAVIKYSQDGKYEGKYFSPSRGLMAEPYHEGLNIADTSGIIRRLIKPLTFLSYQAGFHFFLDKKDAEEMYNELKYLRNVRILECQIVRKNITAMGIQLKKKTIYSITGKPRRVIVASKAVFPKFNDDKIIFGKMSYGIEYPTYWDKENKLIRIA